MLCQVSDFEDYICLFILAYLIYPKTNDEKWQDGVLNVPTIAKYPLHSKHQSCKILFEDICGSFEMKTFNM